MIVYVDGGCSANNQRDLSCRHMVAVVLGEDGSLLSKREEPGGSNNIAELIAVRDALRWAIRHEHDEVEVRTDSRNNIAWVFNKSLGKRLNDRARVEQLRHEIAAAR